MIVKGQIYLKIITLILVTFLLLYIVIHHKAPEVITKENPQYAAIAKFVTDDILLQASKDSTLNRGGLMYNVSEIYVREKEAIVSLVLRSTLPNNHPNYSEYPTEFYYVVSLQDGALSIVSRPNSQAMKEKHAVSYLLKYSRQSINIL